MICMPKNRIQITVSILIYSSIFSLTARRFEFYDGIDEVLAKQDLDTSELFQFLTKQSGVAPQGDYYKYLVWKDGVTVTAYNHRAGPIEVGEIQYDLGNCLKS